MRFLLTALTLSGIAVMAILLPAAASSDSTTPGNNVLARGLAIELGKVKPEKWEQKLSSGAIYPALQASGALEERANAAGGGNPNSPSCASKFTGGGQGAAKNIRVNQDCSFRRQAEEVLAVNPTDPDNLIAGQNDSVIGFNHCGYDFSFDGGKTWGSQVPPFYQFLLASGHTADACSDPTATFDSKGNAYVAGILFDVASPASAFVVAKSNAGIGGAFYHTPAALSFQTYRTTPLGVVASDNDPNVFHDKEFIVADANASSPKVDNVYATWTRFANTAFGVGGNSPIYFSQSTNGGATWSPGIEVSGANTSVCTAFSGSANPNACDQNQGSHPIVGADGTIYVSFNNGNLPGAGIAQQLFVKCPANKDCRVAASWTSPVKIASDIATQPIGPSATSGCPGGRQCLPPNGYRMNDFGALSVDNSGKLLFTWSDFRNGGGAGSTCPALGNAATIPGGCDNDVFYSYSNDGGATWSAPFNVSPKATFGATAQWQGWGAVAADGAKYYVAYYDRSYGNCEFDGCNDITLATVTNAASATPSVAYSRITTSSMPNLTPANNPLQAGFLGDYMWVTTDNKGRANTVWADTRGQGGAVEEDIYFARTP
jgi:hypothetical protein